MPLTSPGRAPPMAVFARSMPISLLSSVDTARLAWFRKAAATWEPNLPLRLTTGPTQDCYVWKDHQFHLLMSRNTMVPIKYAEVLNRWWLFPPVSHVLMSIFPSVNFHWRTIRILWLVQQLILRLSMPVTTQHHLTPFTHILLRNPQYPNTNFVRSTWILV